MNKEKIASLVWKLTEVRGSASIDECFKIAAYILLLKYIELEKDKYEFYQKTCSVSYLALTYGKVIGNEELLNYFTEVERAFHIESELFCRNFQKLLPTNPGKSEDAVCAILQVVDQMDIQNKEECRNILKELIDRYLQVIPARDQTGTSYNIAEIEAGILDVQNGMSVYDCFCGFGVSASVASSGKGELYLQDINSSLLDIAAIICIINDEHYRVIKCGDSITDPISLGQTYDRIICEAPFGFRLNKDFTYDVSEKFAVYPEQNGQSFFPLQHVIASLKPDGIGVALVPLSSLYHSGHIGKIREVFIKDGYIESVLELPGGVVPGVGTASALLVLTKKQTRKIFLMKTDGFFERKRGNQILSKEHLQEIIEIYRGKQIVEGVSAYITEADLKKNEYNLSTTQYVCKEDLTEIVITDTTALLQKMQEVNVALSEVDKELNVVRERFLK